MANVVSPQMRRACLDGRWPMPPRFLLPFTACLSTASQGKEPFGARASRSDEKHALRKRSGHHNERKTSTVTAVGDSSQTSRLSMTPTRPLRQELQSNKPSQEQPIASVPSSSQLLPARTSVELSPSIRELLPILQAQGSHYITAHIYDRPYLLTIGDTVRLPFLMKGVNPGDVLRLNRASNIGSRDFTLKAAAKETRARSPTASTIAVIDPTPGLQLSSQSRVMPTARPSAGLGERGEDAGAPPVPHFVPHHAKGQTPYLHESLFVCRAVVMGVESEPLRIKEKTKRRQRKVKKVKSKHRFTILKVKELRIRSLDKIEAGQEE